MPPLKETRLVPSRDCLRSAGDTELRSLVLRPAGVLRHSGNADGSVFCPTLEGDGLRQDPDYDDHADEESSADPEQDYSRAVRIEACTDAREEERRG